MPLKNEPAPGVPFYTPLQSPPTGTPLDPDNHVKVFKPIKIRDVEFHNRIFLSPLCQYSAKDGFVTPWHMAHLGGILSRGPALAIVEATAVLPEGRITPEDVGIWSDDHVEGLKGLVDFAHSQSQKIGIQLAHAGRKASTLAPWISFTGKAEKEANGWPDNVWGPSDVPFSETFPPVKELTKEGIREVVKAFGAAAQRAVKAGFDVIEVHGAHGYLITSFLSPASNKRTDEYGGSFENRIRILLEVVDEVRRVIPQGIPLFVRVSGTEWLESKDIPSWRVEDTIRLAPLLAERGVDLLDVSSGGNSSDQKIVRDPNVPAYQAFLAHAVKKAVGDKLLVGAVGNISTGAIAEDVLDKGSADVVLVGRWFQQNPFLVWTWADELGVDIQIPNQIRWAFFGRGRAKKN